MKKNVLLLLVIILQTFAVFSQEKVRYWDEGKLTWNDFQGAPQNNSSYSSYLNYYIGYQNDRIKKHDTIFFGFNTVCYIDPQGSWAKNEGKTDIYLKYNQTIFDIAELNRRQLQIELEKSRILDNQHLLNQVSSNTFREVNEFVKQTNYGRDSLKIKILSDSVSNLLKKTENHKLDFVFYNLGYTVSYSWGMNILPRDFNQYLSRVHFALQVSVGVKYKKFYFPMAFNFSSSKFRTDFSVFQTDEKVSINNYSLGIGYIFYDAQKLKILPYLSIGAFSLENDSPKSQAYAMPSLSLLTEYKIRKYFNLLPINGQRKSFYYWSVAATTSISYLNFENIKGLQTSFVVGVNLFFNPIKEVR